MQTPVRYYITRDDDRPVVRSIPVTMRSRNLEDQIFADHEVKTTEPEKTAGRARVAAIMRNAVRRPSSAKE